MAEVTSAVSIRIMFFSPNVKEALLVCPDGMDRLPNHDDHGLRERLMPTARDLGARRRLAGAIVPQTTTKEDVSLDIALND